jgi:hypothetical protein
MRHCNTPKSRRTLRSPHSIIERRSSSFRYARSRLPAVLDERRAKARHEFVKPQYLLELAAALGA